MSHGFESLRKLCKMYHMPPKARAVGRLTKILQPSGMERGNFEVTLAAWEDAILNSEKETDAKLMTTFRSQS